MADRKLLPAIIAGSGLPRLSDMQISERVEMETVWGRPSGPVVIGKIGGVKVLFLARHGIDNKIAPHKINYRANVAALEELGASHILSFNIVGGISAAMVVGAFVVPHQLIDYTWGREQTFFDSPRFGPQHVDFTNPYDDGLRQALIKAARQINCELVDHGNYGVTQGPRLESAAEVTRLERDGCDIVGMTGMPEAGLAREKQVPYACLALVVNPAAGKSARLISVAEITQVVSEAIPSANTILAATCKLIPAQAEFKK
jgi:5'-methylthioinosine phosphorylase